MVTNCFSTLCVFAHGSPKPKSPDSSTSVLPPSSLFLSASSNTFASTLSPSISLLSSLLLFTLSCFFISILLLFTLFAPSAPSALFLSTPPLSAPSALFLSGPSTLSALSVLSPFTLLLFTLFALFALFALSTLFALSVLFTLSALFTPFAYLFYLPRLLPLSYQLCLLRLFFLWLLYLNCSRIYQLQNVAD